MRALALTIARAAIALGAASCGAGADPAVAEAGHVVYLRFADGTFGVARGADDDATRDASRLCATDRFAAWSGAAGCGDRDSCREAIRAGVAGHFAAYDVAFTLDRPAPGAVYTEVIVAPPSEDCTFGSRGVALADCGDMNPSNVAFVFDCDAEVDVGVCAVLVAHETAHTFGLVHVVDATDVMVAAPDDASLGFRASSSPTNPNECSVARQSSHEALLAALGPARR